MSGLLCAAVWLVWIVIEVFGLDVAVGNGIIMGVMWWVS